MTNHKPAHFFATLSRRLSVLFFSLALIGLGAVLVTDGLRQFRFTTDHQRMGAFPLILIGLSYMSFQFSAQRQGAERVKGLLLGLAFVLWGSEQLLPPSPLVTVMDGLVISIFVVDLALIIIEHLRRKDHETP